MTLYGTILFRSVLVYGVHVSGLGPEIVCSVLFWEKPSAFREGPVVGRGVP